MSPDLLSDVNEYAIAKRFGVQPWEAGDVPEYWITRAVLFDKVFDQVQRHRSRQGEHENENENE